MHAHIHVRSLMNGHIYAMCMAMNQFLDISIELEEFLQVYDISMHVQWVSFRHTLDLHVDYIYLHIMIAHYYIGMSVYTVD